MTETTIHDAFIEFAPNSVHQITENMVFPIPKEQVRRIVLDNVTLIFLNGAQIKTEKGKTLELIGKNSTIVAPAIQIFGEGVIAKGDWNVDRVYPQWFGCKTYKECPRYWKVIWDPFFENLSKRPRVDIAYLDRTIADATEAINKAIMMRRVGEVFLPKGYYVIKDTIKLNTGIQLVGDIGMSEADKTRGLDATILIPWKRDDSPATINDNKFLVDVNTHIFLPGKSNPGFLSGQITAIRRMCFYSPQLPWSYIEKIKRYRKISYEEIINRYTAINYGAVFSKDSLCVENVRFDGFRRAVVFANSYIDVKKIVDCDYTGDWNSWELTKFDVLQFESKERNKSNVQNENSASVMPDVDVSFKNINYTRQDVYAFDIDGWGDGLIFEHNAIHSIIFNKALHVGSTRGASITANIINNDCFIDSAKNTDFACNHMEGGAQIVIATSEVQLRGNFIEKGSRPSIIVRGTEHDDRSIVNLTNNSFMFYEGNRGGDDKESDSEKLERLQNRMNHISEFDICIDEHTILSLDNCFRYWIRTDLAGKSYPCGIKMAKVIKGELTSESIDDFNDYSYKLSSHGQIKVNFNVEKQFTLKNPNINISGSCQVNNSANWLIESGKYSYSFLILWDRQRNIVETFSGDLKNNKNFGFPLPFPQENKVGGPVVLSLTTSTDGGGVLLKFTVDVFDYEMMVRLFRNKVDDGGHLISRSYVDVPVCGTRFLYDNGISVCGYKWKAVEELPDVENCSNIDAIDFRDSTICMRSHGAIPATVKLKTGDMVIKKSSGSNENNNATIELI